ERVPAAALADEQEIGLRNLAQDSRPRLEQRRVALLRLEPRDDADDLGPRLHPVFLGERAARLLVVVALEVDAVIDQADRDGGATLVDQLRLAGLGDGDEPIEVWCQLE